MSNNKLLTCKTQAWFHIQLVLTLLDRSRSPKMHCIQLLVIVDKQIRVQAHWIDCTHHVVTGTYAGMEGVPTWCGI